MAQCEVHKSSLIEPAYTQSEIDAPILIGTFPVNVTSRGTTTSGVATVRIIFHPDARLVLEVTGETHAGFWMLLREDPIIEIPALNLSVPAIEVGVGEFVPRTSVVQVTTESLSITKCLFHLFNFPNFYSSGDYIIEREESGKRRSTRAGKLTLVGGGWRITIAALETTHDSAESLKNSRGWIITHAAEIVRENGAAFSSDELKSLLHCVHYCISFALGRWTALALPVGFDESGARVFEQWGFPVAASGSWAGGSSWFDALHGDMLARLFPGFLDVWNAALWHSTISEVIYWYLGACDRSVGVGVDTGVILAQTALERLAWTYCVQERKLVTKEAFAGRSSLSASNKFRMLVSSLGIPTDVPATLRALNGRPGSKWIDSLDAITSVRNSIVHPSSDGVKIPAGWYWDVYRLSLWYLELIVLKICKYDYKYGNRLADTRWSGQVEYVPWVPTPPGSTTP